MSWLPRRAIKDAKEGHLHKKILGPGGPTPATTGGIVHYDYVVDASYGGAEGDTISLGSGGTAIVYTTVQGAVTAADAANAVRTILINAGTYSESVTLAATLVHDLWIVGEARGRVQIGASGA